MLNKLWDTCTIHMSRFHKAGVELKRMFTYIWSVTQQFTEHFLFTGTFDLKFVRLQL